MCCLKCYIFCVKQGFVQIYSPSWLYIWNKESKIFNISFAIEPLVWSVLLILLNIKKSFKIAFKLFLCDHCSTGIKECVFVDLPKQIPKLANAWKISNTERTECSFNCHFHASALISRWTSKIMLISSFYYIFILKYFWS